MRIAVCEDEKGQQEHIRNLIEEWKNQTGCTASVDFFTSGEHFLTAWDAGNSFAIVFLDIHLAGFDGMKTAKKIRERDEFIKLTEKIKSQILAIRDTGLTNMFDKNMVQRLAYEREMYELVMFLEDNVKEYVKFIMYGDRALISDPHA